MHLHETLNMNFTSQINKAINYGPRSRKLAAAYIIRYVMLLMSHDLNDYYHF